MTALNSLVESDRSFARAAAELGANGAFRAYLADDAILFRPRAVNAQEWLREAPDNFGLLSWEPVLASVSTAGDLGFTTGPWEYREDPDGPAVEHGNYFTVWELQANGSWKALVDHGTRNPAPESIASLRLPAKDSDERRLREYGLDLEAEREVLLQVDRAFAGSAATNGTLQALAAYVTSDVRVLRNDRQPLDGIEAFRTLIAERPGTFDWRVLGGGASRSGDLGYTYGEYRFTAAGVDVPIETGVYLRAWRRGANGSGNWRVVVDLMTPLPDPPGD
ncbi:MAG: hypothetical protein JSV86_09040 [Gemmatimonadota bacterium]|nr:MAG: hypothetical protein JSV86_09040 [Gemmatimonadota bacterium]